MPACSGKGNPFAAPSATTLPDSAAFSASPRSSASASGNSCRARASATWGKWAALKPAPRDSADSERLTGNGKLHIEHIDWEKPKDISINGIKWAPNWDCKKSDAIVGFTTPLAPFAGANVTVKLAKKVTKNCGVKVLEPPTETNGRKLVVHLQDEGSGASEFEVHIT